LKTVRRTIRVLTYPILKGLRPGNIVMYHLGRCGSTVLGQLLSKTKGVYWHGEVYNRIFKNLAEGYTTESVRNKYIKGYAPDPIYQLKGWMKLAGYHYYGFEIKPFHNKLMNIPLKEYIDSIEKLGFNYFIILDRRNRLRKIISSIIAHKHPNKWHIKRELDNKPVKLKIDCNKVVIDFDSKPLIEYLKDYDQQFEVLGELLKNKTNYLKLYYEDDIQEDPQKAYINVCNYLNISHLELNTSLKRTNPFKIETMVENFKELESYLKNTPYEWMLYD